jgi:hypothetical protein
MNGGGRCASLNNGISQRPQWIPAVVLLREIRQRGYEAG